MVNITLRKVLIFIVTLTFGPFVSAQIDLGNLSSNPYLKESSSNKYGAGSKYNLKSINNPYGIYGSKYSNKSATNPYATDAPKLYDSQGNYKGKLSANKYDPESISNPYSIYSQVGSKDLYSKDSISNPYGTGLKIIGSDD
ncbi:hypothetical protein N9D99_08500 [Gammaproteobacteria bacterium]|nr:hypothetical protein [Gammaproteobacteria bacterium]